MDPIKANQMVVNIGSIELEHNIPKNAGSNPDEWTAKQSQEYHRREGEKESIRLMDAKIEAEFEKVKKLQLNRHFEVTRINTRRSIYDEKIEKAAERKRISKAIRKRKREEEDQKAADLDIPKRIKLEDVK
ncbi:hypothetical protein GCK72_025603 [Caenorhabditis remanei]|uniref:Uncharacterized protein n=1 Tax=Caenorhabditis remanei TaxID=31234 RepID=A0A6A5G2L0_CAERE|nr:hypothetical protein GCK72_025603 [Caenorhabditis remanei]KAF1749136.1 hypothetical protein GCK72_025603 [Caenorhabditis remanei]